MPLGISHHDNYSSIITGQVMHAVVMVVSFWFTQFQLCDWHVSYKKAFVAFIMKFVFKTIALGLSLVIISCENHFGLSTII